MSFVLRSPSAPVPEDLVEFYRTLPKRAKTETADGSPTDLWVHQGEIVRAYAPRLLDRRDVALQLPTGAGKTLVGGLIAEWRRQKLWERVVLACPTRQLASQTQAKLDLYGMQSVLLIGKQRQWSAADRTRYSSAQAIGVTTYSAIFNSNPVLHDAQLLILDDAHAGEGYVAGHWSLKISRDDAAYNGVLDVLAPALDPLVVTRLRQPDGGGKYAKEVYLASAVGVAAVAGELGVLLQRAKDAGGITEDAGYALDVLRDHLDRTLVYASYREVLIRPLICPTSSHPAFENPKQRLYMSATLGEGGELERAFGRTKIERIKVPPSWDRQGTGRRFFCFPQNATDLADAGDATQAQRVAQTIDGLKKAVLLAPDSYTLRTLQTSSIPTGMTVYTPEMVERDLRVFSQAPQGVLAMANRYDGIDLPDNDCRLVVMAGLPARGNLQERFLAGDLGAIEVLQERIRARIVQGAGRATRNATDFAIILLLGSDLTTFVSRKEVQDALHPEVHAELQVGLDSSYIPYDALWDNMRHFLARDTTWQQVESHILGLRAQYTPLPPPGSAELARSAPFEVMAWQAIWQGEPERAMEYARQAIDALRGGRAPQRYAALWNYVLASWLAITAEERTDPSLLDAARNAFQDAQACSRGTLWLTHMASPADRTVIEGTPAPVIDPLDALAVQQAAARLDKWRGPATFEPMIEEIRSRLAQTEADPFENALVKLGLLAAASDSVGDGDADAAPDASWAFGSALWVAWEAKSDADPAGEVSVHRVTQANGHLLYMSAARGEAIPSGSLVVLTTPKTAVHPTARNLAQDHTVMVPLTFPQELMGALEQAWRAIRTTVAPGSDPEQVEKAIYETFAEKGCLPSQWIKYLEGQQLRPPTED